MGPSQPSACWCASMYSMAFLALALSTGSSVTKASGTSPSSQYGTRSQPSALPPNQALFLDVRPELVQVPAQTVGLDAQLILEPPRRPDASQRQGLKGRVQQGGL